MTPYCRGCGKVCPKVLDQTWAEWEAMKYCDAACRTVHEERLAAKNAQLIAEIEHLWGSDSRDRIAQRLGFTLSASLARRLHNCGRHDLAVRFERVSDERVLA